MLLYGDIIKGLLKENRDISDFDPGQ
jgi:hypothetical protein